MLQLADLKTYCISKFVFFMSNFTINFITVPNKNFRLKTVLIKQLKRGDTPFYFPVSCIHYLFI